MQREDAGVLGDGDEDKEAAREGVALQLSRQEHNDDFVMQQGPLDIFTVNCMTPYLFRVCVVRDIGLHDERNHQDSQAPLHSQWRDKERDP